MSPTTTRPRRRPRKEVRLAELLRAEGAKPCGGQPPGMPNASDDRAASAAPPPTKGEAMAAALYELATKNKDLAAMRVILDYCEGRPAQVQVNIAQNRPAKTYIVVSPDDWPEA